MAQDLAKFIPALRFSAAKLRVKDLEGAGVLTHGNIWYVDSGSGSDSANAGKRPEDAFATIDFAIGKCTANNGDVIFVMPGHDENPTTSITADVAGIWIYGLGHGSDRPTITFGAEGATLAISAASVKVSNLIFDLGTVAATVTSAITITADSAIVEGCETVVHATSQFTSHLTATDAQFVQILNNKFHSLGAAGSTSGVVLDGCDDLEMIGNSIHGHFGEHALDNKTPATCDEILRANIAYNYITNVNATAGDLAVHLDDAATGIFADNMLVSGVATITGGFNIGNMASMNSRIADDGGIDVHGIFLGAAAA